jgi:protein-histidine pros-kinase
MKLLAKFNLILFVIFGTSALLISHLAYSFLIGNARREVLQQAQLMMASARSVRDYTATDLSPLLQQNPRHRVHFLPETIPSHAATSTFEDLRKDNPQYSNYLYKEAALNPTNLEDRPADWEADVIYTFRNHSEPQITSERQTSSGRSLYIASPIRSGTECLECHGIPSSAPRAMVAVYGSENGFGWKKDEVIGAQIISVPMTVPIGIANQAYHRLLFYLALTMLLVILAFDAGVYSFVIRPLKLVSDTADRVSRGEKNVPPIRVKGRDEIATVALSFNRMQVSVAKAMKMFEDQ